MGRGVWVASLAGLLGVTALAVHAADPAHAQEREQRGADEREQRGADERERPTAEADEVDPRAAAVVRRMSDYLTNLRRFEVTADSMTEVVLDSGQKLQLVATSNVQLDRPNLRSERRGELAHVTFYYDGDTITIYGQRQNMYAQADAPDDLDAALDFTRERLDADAPGADLLYSDSYEGLMEGVRSGIYVGPAEIDGVVCDHVAFQGEEVDFQLWVEQGERPLPRRYVIVTKDQQAAPEFAVDLHDWNLSPTFAAGTFSFEPPPGAQRIEFLEQVEARRLARGRIQGGEEGAGT